MHATAPLTRHNVVSQTLRPVFRKPAVTLSQRVLAAWVSRRSGYGNTGSVAVAFDTGPVDDIQSPPQKLLSQSPRCGFARVQASKKSVLSLGQAASASAAGRETDKSLSGLSLKRSILLYNPSGAGTVIFALAMAAFATRAKTNRIQ